MLLEYVGVFCILWIIDLCFRINALRSSSVWPYVIEFYVFSVKSYIEYCMI